MLGASGLLLAIPSHWHHLCSIHDALNWPRIMFGVTDILLAIHGQNQIGCYWPPSDYSIHQEYFLSPPKRIQHGQDDIV